MARSRKMSTSKFEPSGVAVIYARFSSHSQREVSIEQQIKACTEYANRANLRVVDLSCCRRKAFAVPSRIFRSRSF